MARARMAKMLKRFKETIDVDVAVDGKTLIYEAATDKMIWGEAPTSGGGGGEGITQEQHFTIATNGETSFVLSQSPNSTKVAMFINGISYFENIHFTVDRTTNTATWTNTSLQGGFDLVTTDAVTFRYKVYDANAVTEDTLFTQVVGEVPTGTKDGVNTVFTLASTSIEGTEKVFVNGVRYMYLSDYTIVGNQITFVRAPQIEENILVDYVK